MLRAIQGFLRHLPLGLLSVIWLVPLAWLVMTSFRAENGAYTTYLFPRGWTMANYTRLFTETGLFNYPRWYANTFIVALCSCIISTLFVLMVAYTFSRLRFKSRTPMMNVVLVLGMFPGFMSMIAVYHVLKAIGMEQSLASLVLVYSGGAGMSYYISKGFFDTVPRSMDEAALLDGATRSQVMWKIVLPMSKPTITYTILTSFMAPWVDFIFASVIMKDRYENYTIAVGLYRMLERENIYEFYTRFCAGAVLIAIPITILFIAMQKYYVGGVTGGAVKG
ncbi:MAG: sugar ABC transporter permease [Clostridiales bacterium]|nr:sugar ABC transporter permease [Clostridiales bacterium]